MRPAMSTETYEVFAVRYAHNERRSPENFLGGDSHDVDMPLDYYAWVIRNGSRTVVLDTGFDQAMADRRGRTLLRPLQDGLAMLGISHEEVHDVIISHMHYDHCGNHALFPGATFHVQDAEMAFATGRCMCHHIMRHPFDVDDVTTMVTRLYDGRLAFHDEDEDLFPGISLHRVGGHSRGLQVVRVATQRGYVLLGSDAAHFYANIERRQPYPVVDSVADAIAGIDRMMKLASSPEHIVPGHDPLVLSRYPNAIEGVGDIVRLDCEPKASRPS